MGWREHNPDWPSGEGPHIVWVDDDESMRTVLGECDGCGADLCEGETHDCPVTGSIVTVESMGTDD